MRSSIHGIEIHRLRLADSLALAGGLMSRTDFRSSPWFVVAFVYFAGIIPASLVVLLDSGFTPTAKFLAGVSLAATTAVIAWFGWRRLPGRPPGPPWRLGG